MELTYPWIVIVGMVITLLLLLIRPRRQKIAKGIQKKVANTEYVRETSYYKSLMRKYYFTKVMIYLLLIACISGTLLLISRPVKVTKQEEVEYKKDIFLCLDVSSSMNHINQQIAQVMQEMVTSLSGERFGIVIFDSSPVVLVPLTDDYHYISQKLIQLEEAFSTKEKSRVT